VGLGSFTATSEDKELERSRPLGGVVGGNEVEAVFFLPLETLAIMFHSELSSVLNAEFVDVSEPVERVNNVREFSSVIDLGVESNILDSVFFFSFGDDISYRI
jgi:hypothetical protein